MTDEPSPLAEAIADIARHHDDVRLERSTMARGEGETATVWFATADDLYGSDPDPCEALVQLAAQVRSTADAARRRAELEAHLVTPPGSPDEA